MQDVNDHTRPRPNPIRLLIVDDDAVYRSGLKAILSPARGQVQIVGEASDCEQALAKVVSLRPDVVLFDLNLPPRPGLYARPQLQHGLDAIRAVRSRTPETRILVLSGHETPDELFKALQAGALGYLVKRDVEAMADIVEPIVSVYHGRAIFGPALAELVQRFFMLGLGTEPTHAELDDLDRVASGDDHSAAMSILEKLQTASGDSVPSDFPDPNQDTEIQSVSLFYSYSHADEEFRNELDNHLTLLKRLNVIRGWHDRNIEAGTEWNETISAEIRNADIILLLISSSFLASDYCWSVETRIALDRHREGDARVIPIIVRTCDWKDAPFGKLQALPKDGKPITSWADRDAAFTDVARGIRAAIGAIRR